MGYISPKLVMIFEESCTMSELDATDQRILTLLQRKGRMTNVELSESVPLSPSACHRRVQRLEAEGVIRDYVALLDARKLGRPTTGAPYPHPDCTPVRWLRESAAMQLPCVEIEDVSPPRLKVKGGESYFTGNVLCLPVATPEEAAPEEAACRCCAGSPRRAHYPQWCAHHRC